MTKIRLVWYWKRYMRKGRYRCKRYFLYLPVAIGNRLDRSVDYIVRLFGLVIILVPKDVEFSLSRLANPKIVNRHNAGDHRGSLTDPLLNDSKENASSKLP
jgi:hypothetical protein